MNDNHKTPRLYVPAALNKNQAVELTPGQAHYLRSVLRLNENEGLRLFNAQDGEWAAKLIALGKKTATALPQEQTRTQPTAREPIELLFAPIKKNRMDILIEKAVELGATDLHPVITAHTENRKLNIERITAQIIEAAEQCERLDIPKIHDPLPLKAAMVQWTGTNPIYWAAERNTSATKLCALKEAAAFLIGPEGGFNEDENLYLNSLKTIRPISLGPQILRAETAALACLAHTMLLQDTKK